MRRLLAGTLLALLLVSCRGTGGHRAAGPSGADILPITGTWVNLAWKDVRNQYTNPAGVPMTDPALWRTKVQEWKDLGLEYLVLMEVANEGEAFYPSDVMPHAYPAGQESPVEAILSEASAQGMKVFLSTGWAVNQDEDIRKPEIQARQQQIMEELTALFTGSPAFYGWYLPVEDCITPVFAESAVAAVNRLVEKARALTPGKKTLISPYGMVYAQYDRPDFARNIRNLKVDIIAYQDEVGCVREPFPMRRLKEHWKRLREVHEGSGIELWANCETFTWEKGTNDRSSALIPAAYSRLLAQQIAASEGGVSRIVSFMFGGILEKPGSPYALGQPVESEWAWRNYRAWKDGCPYWQRVQESLRGALVGTVPASCPAWPRLTDGVLAEMDPEDSAWEVFPAGSRSLALEWAEPALVERVLVRCLDLARWDVLPPSRVTVCDGEGRLLAVEQFTAPANNRHDAWIDFLEIPLQAAGPVNRLVLSFETDHKVCIDEIYVNP